MAAVRTAKKLLLGREIDHMIAAAGTNQVEAAKIIDTSQGRIAGLISGQGSITIGDLERLATKLGFTDHGYLEALFDLRRDNHKRGFWTTGHMRTYHEDVRLLVDLESHADLLRAVQCEIMPGLVQCEAYLRAVHEGNWPEPASIGPEVTVEQAVEARLARQEVLVKADPPEFRAVLSESCLRRVYGNAEVMRDQIAHLIKLSKRPNILIQVVPFTVTTRRVSMADRFTLVRVPSPGVAGPLELAYVEAEGDIRYLDDKKGFSARESVWSRLSAAALNAEDSRRFLEYTDGLFR
jgi:plasmid maintenance system antidote protein VapI